MAKFKALVTTAAITLVVIVLVAGGVFFYLENQRRKIQEQRDLVEGYLRSGNYQEAQSVLRPLVAQTRTPEQSAEIRAIFMEVLMKNGNMEEAIAIGQDLVKKYPGRPQAAKAYYLLGYIARKHEKDFESAKANYKTQPHHTS